MTKDNWHSMDCMVQDASGQVVANAVVKGDSLWFSGHFPGWPILPGIAMLSMVTDAVRCDERKRGNQVRITGIKRVRFRLPIHADDPIAISVSRTKGESEDSYSFRIAVRQDIACTGIVMAERIA